jgi:hypothetical protein
MAYLFSLCFGTTPVAGSFFTPATWLLFLFPASTGGRRGFFRISIRYNDSLRLFPLHGAQFYQGLADGEAVSQFKWLVLKATKGQHSPWKWVIVFLQAYDTSVTPTTEGGSP